ncbi:unnamed protein product [Allacma fusca]|uniref:Uncharacterized protein n=1 Tax=Allacma fusca TaxID=39272 RepID=A0A8J2KQE1_9HEXA|nr:unnamed protein product [Allacma fusca]
MQVGKSTKLIVWTTSAIFNVIAKSIGNSVFRVPGILLSVLLSLSLIFLYTRGWTKKTSFLFYASFFPNLVWNSFDFLTVVELWTKPSKGFLSEYVSMNEPLINNFCIHGIAMFDGVVLGAANYMVLYLIHNGIYVKTTC